MLKHVFPPYFWLDPKVSKKSRLRIPIRQVLLADVKSSRPKDLDVEILNEDAAGELFNPVYPKPSCTRL
jgi:hypothetical protein